MMSFYLILILGLVIGFLFGLKRGLVRSSIRLGLFLVFVIIGGLITIPISNAIAKIDISGINWVVGEQTITTLPEGIKATLLQSEQIAKAVEEMPSLLSIIESLPSAIISILVFMLLVLIMSLLSWIVYIIIERFALRQSRLERKAKKQIKEDRKKLKGKLIKPTSVQIIVPKENRRRWLGAAVGTVCSFVFLFCLFIPISSITSTISQIASSSYSVSAEDSQQSELLTETSSDLLKYYIGEETISYVNAYSQSVPGKILTLGGFDDVIFDSFSSFSVNDEKISFRNDLLNVCKAYDELIFLIDQIGASENYKNIDFDKIESIFDKIFDIGFFRSVAEEAIPYALTFVYDSEAFVNFEYNQQVETAINNVVESLKSSKSGFVETLREDISYILKVCQSACEVGLVDSLMGGERDLSTFLNALTLENDKLLNSLTENLTSSFTLKSILTNGINLGFEIVKKETNDELYLGKLDQNKIDWGSANTSINSLIKNSIDAYNILDKYGMENFSFDIKFIFTENFKTSDFNNLIKIVSKELQLLRSSPLFVSQEINSYNQLVDYVVSQETANKLLDPSVLKEINFEQEFSNLIPALSTLKDQGVLEYIFEQNSNINGLCKLLVIEESLENKTYVETILKPVLDSKLSQKPIKFIFELFNENINSVREKIGQEVVEIDLSNFTYLSAADKEKFIDVFENLVLMVDNIGFDVFVNDTLSTILTLNDLSEKGTINSSFIVNILNSLSNISILKQTYNSIFVAAGNNESINQYVTLQEAAKEDFSWSKEFEVINKIIEILEKQNNGDSVISLIFPNNKFEKVEITNELISKIFDNLKLPLYETQPESSSIKVFVEKLYDSKILKQTLVYIVNTICENVAKAISTEESPVTLSKINLINLTADQEEDIVLVFESLANSFSILTKDNFDLGNMTDEEIEKIGVFLNSLKENAYDYQNGQPNPNCVLSADGKTVENGGIFAELYIAMIDYAKQTFSFSGDVSYGEIEWINFLKTAKKLEELSTNKGNILDILSDPESGVDVGEALSSVGVSQDTSSKISGVQDSFTNIDPTSSESFKDLSESLGNISQENADEIVNFVENTIGSDISSSVDLTQIQKEQAVSNRISILMKEGLTDGNLEESLTELCNGATIVLTRAVSLNVKIQNNSSSILQNIFTKIDEKTTDETVRSLVKTLFAVEG